MSAVKLVRHAKWLALVRRLSPGVADGLLRLQISLPEDLAKYDEQQLAQVMTPAQATWLRQEALEAGLIS